jgi:hypothetical protein
MANGDDGMAVVQELTSAIAREYGWKGFEPLLVDATPLTPAQRAEFVGSYGKGAVVVSGDGPLLDVKFGHGHIVLIPQGSDQFMPASPMPLFKAIRGPDGKISAVSVGSAQFARDP